MNMEEEGPVRVSEGVARELEAIRRSGLTNMLDRAAVIRLCRTYEYTEAAEWVRRNPDLYAKAIFRGFRAIDNECSTADLPEDRGPGAETTQGHREPTDRRASREESQG